jgi:ATP-dependent NAD(P)H-hydrate dehydratase
VAVIGGSEEFTGAPYYAAISALRAGADLSHVYCPPEASVPIKCYSPELIVHNLVNGNEFETVKQLNAVAKTIVIGPGLGRSTNSFILLSRLLQELVKSASNQLNYVFDADALWYIATQPSIKECVTTLQTQSNSVILTPNLIEFKRIWEATHKDPLPSVDDELIFYKSQELDVSEIEIDHPLIRPIAELSRELGNVKIVRKGLQDVITDGRSAIYVKQQGSSKRCGGIGDILAGTIGTFSQYAFTGTYFSETDDSLKRKLVPLAMACLTVRFASCFAFERKGISLVSPDIIDELSHVLKEAQHSLH